MAGKRYSAGKIFLQVVPSFDNLQKDISKEVNRANAGLEKQAERDGQKQGEARGRGEAKAARKVRQMSDIEQIAHDEKQLDASRRRKLRDFQKFSQMMIAARVRQASDEQAAVDRINKGALAARIRQGQREHAQAVKDAQTHQSGLDRLQQNALKDGLKRIHDQRIADLKDAQNHADNLARMHAKSMSERMKAIRAESEALAKQRDLVDRDHGRGLAEQIRRSTKEKLERDRVQGGRYGQDLRKSAGAAAANIPQIQVGADTSAAERKLEELRVRLLSLADAKVGVDLSAAEAHAEIVRLMFALGRLDGKDVEIDVRVNSAAARAELAGIRGAGDDGGSSGMFNRNGDSAGNAANAFRIFKLRILGIALVLPLLSPLLAVAAAGIAALSVAAMAGAAGLGVMLLGFSGIGGALQAMGAAQDAQAKSGTAAAKKQKTDARAMRDALQGVDKARLAGARAAEDSAERIKDAQDNIGDIAKRNARAAEDSARRVADAQANVGEVAQRNADRMRGALRTQQDAERSLARAQQDATRAQENLAAARKQAQQDQQDLADRIAGGKLDERQALIDLFDAQVAYNSAQQDGAATNKEREQASITLERARLSIKGIRGDNKELAAESTKAITLGVAGAAGVVAAERAVADAKQSTADAQRGVADAAQDVADARAQGAKDTAEAQRGLADAQRDAAQQAVDSAAAVADATDALADARRDAAEQAVDSAAAIRDAQERVGDAAATAAEGLSAETTAIDNLKLAMDKLSPAGRDFATWLFSLKPLFKQIRDTAQEGMLPGVQEGLTTIIDKYGPGFIKFVDSMSKAVGQFFIDLGVAFASPVMEEFFGTMAKYGPELFRLGGKITLDIVKILAGVATAFAPYSKDFLTSLSEMTDGWVKWAQGLKDSQGFKDFMAYIKTEGPVIWQLIKDIATSLKNLLIGMADSPLVDMITGFFSWLSEQSPKTVATIFTIITVFTILSQVISGVVVLLTLIGTVLAFFGIAMSLTVGLVILAVLAVIAIFVWAYMKFDWFKTAVDWVFRMLWTAVKWVFKAIVASVKFYWQGLVLIYETILKPLFQTIRDVVEDMPGYWKTAMDGIYALWMGLKKIVAVPINFAIGVINDGLIDNFNRIAGFFTGDKTTISRIKEVNWGQEAPAKPKAATKAQGASHPLINRALGGPVPGYSPHAKADNIHAMLTAGEFVQPVDVTKYYGLDFMEALRRKEIPRYAGGGLIAFGKKLQSMNYNVQEHPLFPPLTMGAHSPNGQHYNRKGPGGGGAIDVNFDGRGQSTENIMLDKIVKLAHSYGLRTIWRAKDHFDHLHADIGAGSSMGGAGGSSGLPFYIEKPLEFLKNSVDSLMGKIPLKGGIADVLKAVPGKIISSATDWLNKMVSGAQSGDTLDKDPALGAASLFPRGGQWANQGLAKQMMRARGWPASQWPSLQNLWMKESGFNHLISNGGGNNPDNGRAFGIPQSLPGKKMAAAGADWRTNPRTQIAWGLGYIADRYGSPAKAWQHSQAVNWYADGGPVTEAKVPVFDSGGTIPTGYSTILNKTGAPEDLFTRKQLLESRPDGRPNLSVTIPMMPTNSTPEDVASAVIFAQRRIARGGVYAKQIGGR